MKSVVFMICLAVSFCTWMVIEYKENAVHPIGYSAEHRAELDNKIAGLVPLSVADLGE